ncbi:MAG: hypothetical protein EXS63_01545 [Candidatus Omnitrophica bacterium]|nr:hypothetical protein [Candidatus Omnitrophota bacterium]
MKFKKIGKVQIDLKMEEWFIDGVRDRFQINRRLIDTRKDIKKFRSAYVKVIQLNTPSIKKTLKRQDYFDARNEYRKEWTDLLTRVYEEIRKESYTYPVLLQKVKDYDHPREWRHCLYKGSVYAWDRHGYTSEAMKGRIDMMEAPPPDDPSLLSPQD